MPVICDARALSCCLGWILFSLFSLSASSNFKLNVPSILLNYNKGVPSNDTLQVTGAAPDDCFDWRSSNPRIVHVTPIFQTLNSSCSQKAVVSSISDAETRLTNRVSATLKGTETLQLYCDVITDSIASIEISWISDELLMGGPGQVVTMIAKDQWGHTFTSVNGLNIHWNVRNSLDDSTTPAEKDIIRLSSFANSGAWKTRGMLSNAVLVEGINIGTAYVSASIVHSKLSSLRTSDLELRVLPNLKIAPSSSLHVLKYGSVQLCMETMEGGKSKILDESDFEINIKDSSLIEMGENLSQVTAVDYGSTAIIFKSINSNYPDMSLDLQIVKPAHIDFTISKGGFNTLEEMQIYEVYVNLYDADNNKIYPSDNIRLMVNFPAKLFHVHFTTSNGTYCVVQAIAPGSGKIRAEYKGVVKEDGSLSKDNSISGVEDVTVCQKLHIFPPQTFLPFDPSIMPHTISLKASGGTGDYAWALSDPMAASIVGDAYSKSVEIQVYTQADLFVTLTDRNNINFLSTAKVLVKPIIDLETYPTVVEAEIGNTLILSTALLGYLSKEKKNFQKFDNCSKVEPTVEIVDKHVLSFEKEAQIPAFGRGCISMQFRCKLPGYSRVNILYKAKEDGKGNNTFKTTTLLSCFKPLKPVHPVRVAVLALGTSKEVAFEGGPRQWPLYKAGHYTELLPSDPKLLNIKLIKDPVRYNKDLTVFRVTCKELGENDLTFRIGNEQSATIQHPAKSEATIKIICNKPSSLHLKLEKKKTKNAKKLSDENIVKVPFYGNKEFSVDVWIKDSTGRKLANISSFHMEWEVSDKSLAHPESYTGFDTHDNAVAGYRKLTRNFKVFKMSGITGNLQVRAKVTAYREDVLLKEGIEESASFEEMTQAIDLKLVSIRDLYTDQNSEDEKKDEGYCDGDSCKE